MPFSAEVRGETPTLWDPLRTRWRVVVTLAACNSVLWLTRVTYMLSAISHIMFARCVSLCTSLATHRLKQFQSVCCQASLWITFVHSLPGWLPSLIWVPPQECKKKKKNLLILEAFIKDNTCWYFTFNGLQVISAAGLCGATKSFNKARMWEPINVPRQK